MKTLNRITTSDIRLHLDGDGTTDCTLSEFVEANRDSFTESEMDAVRNLTVGASIQMDGYVGSAFTVTRIS